MNQAAASKLVNKLKYNLKDRRKLKNVEGLQGRQNKIRKVVTALFKYERIELNYALADESRGYAERLISDALRYGPCHKETMKMASYWILEEQVVHKLFKVLVPRYQNFNLSYTKQWRVSVANNNQIVPKCVLELRNNIYPPLGPNTTNHKNLLHNILLREAKKAYEKEKGLKILEKLATPVQEVNIKNSQDKSDSEGENENNLLSTSKHENSNLNEELDLSKLKLEEVEGKSEVKTELNNDSWSKHEKTSKENQVNKVDKNSTK